MLRNLKDLHGYTLIAQDGEIGRVHDSYFEDDCWIVRYLVVDTGRWLPGRKVLITPNVLQESGWDSLNLRVSLTKEQVKKSPNIDTDLPVSRQMELELHKHYGWPVYWVSAGTGPWPLLLTSPHLTSDSPAEARKPKGDPHLRSVKEVTGYHIHATDGSIGHVADFIANDVGWNIRYLVVDTRNWLPGRQVLIPPQWLLQNINWAAHRVEVALTRESVRNSPEYDPSMPLTREVEEQLHDYYSRPAYWAVGEVKRADNSKAA